MLFFEKFISHFPHPHPPPLGVLTQSAADDDGASGVEEEINIYEELHQEAESVAAGQGSTQVPEPDIVSEEEPEPAKPAAVAAAESKGDDGKKEYIYPAM
jgi:hypothetical protein